MMDAPPERKSPGAVAGTMAARALQMQQSQQPEYSADLARHQRQIILLLRQRYGLTPSVAQAVCELAPFGRAA